MDILMWSWTQEQRRKRCNSDLKHNLAYSIQQVKKGDTKQSNIKCDIYRNDWSCYIQYGDHRIDTRMAVCTCAQTGRPLVTTRGDLDLGQIRRERLSRRSYSKPRVPGLGGSNRAILPSKWSDIHNISLDLPLPLTTGGYRPISLAESTQWQRSPKLGFSWADIHPKQYAPTKTRVQKAHPWDFNLSPKRFPSVAYLGALSDAQTPSF